MNQRTLYLFTRTPLHIGAGASVGAIDQPVVRERHTGFPFVPASSMKGSIADEWNGVLLADKKRVAVKPGGGKQSPELEMTTSAWLFGSDDANHSSAGAVHFSDAKLLAFPVR